MKTWTLGILSLAFLSGLALGADKKEMTPAEKEKMRTQIAAMKDLLTAWQTDDIKVMPASVKPAWRNGIVSSRKQVLAALPEKLSAPSSKKHKILVITIIHGAHTDAQGAMLIILQQMGKKSDAWELTQAAEADLPKITAEQLKGYDAVVINNNFPLVVNPDADAEYTAKVKTFTNELLPAYVKGGGGLFVYHWGIVGKDPYVQMVGASFGGHPPGDGEVFPVKVLDPKNPLMAAFMSEVKPQVIYGKIEVQVPKEFQDELYIYGSVKPDKDPAVRVLLTMDMDHLPPKVQFPKGTTAYPYIWVKHFGEGRIFYSQFGHSVRILSVPAIVRSMLDGLQYVLGDLKAEDAPQAIPASAPAEK